MYLAEGFDDYLSKPIEIKELEKMLVKYIPNRKIMLPESVNEDVFMKETITSADEPLQEEEKEYQYIDVNVGLKYCVYNKEMYREFLKIYYDEREHKISQLTESFSQENWNDYVTYVHSVKSTSLNIGAVSLSELAAQMEKAGKEYLASSQEESLSFVREHQEELMNLYLATNNEISEYLSE